MAWRPQPARSSTARRVWRDADGRLSVTELAQAVRSPRGLRAAARTPRASTAPLELRLLRAIPIANWQLVLPFSRPSFQLKDWARLDLVTPPRRSRPYLAHISRISRAYLAHISRISRAYLAYISQVTLPALLATLASVRYDSPSLNVAAASAVAVDRAQVQAHCIGLLFDQILTRTLTRTPDPKQRPRLP